MTDFNLQPIESVKMTYLAQQFVIEGRTIKIDHPIFPYTFNDIWAGASSQHYQALTPKRSAFPRHRCVICCATRAGLRGVNLEASTACIGDLLLGSFPQSM